MELIHGEFSKNFSSRAQLTARITVPLTAVALLIERKKKAQ